MNEPLVLIPGMMCDARLFADQIFTLGATRPVLVCPPTGGETITDIAKTILDYAPARFALAGLSLGGIIAMELYRKAPERVTRLALMDTNPFAETPQVSAAREPQIIGARAGRLEEVMREEMKPKYLAPGPNRIEILNLVMDMALGQGPEIFVKQSRALQRRMDQQSTLRKIKVPTLVLCGEFDELCPVKRHELMAELIYSAHLKVIKDAGHLPTLEQPVATTEALVEWLGWETT